MKRFIPLLIMALILFFPSLGQTADLDTDSDGLSDAWEIKFKTDISNPDSDGDGYADGLEISNAYNPLVGEGQKLKKNIEVNIKTQKLQYFLGGSNMGEYPVSTGKASTPTPRGSFTVKNKAPRPKSQTYGLWMPYWMGLSAAGIGIHELPEWGKGIKEGASHLGTPVSHGCIRLGVGPAKKLYDWTEVGTEVKIY
ncbi:MAG: L,D-transpeptidase family protein [Patescibacteria group bacterium]